MPIADVLAALSALTPDEQREFATQVAESTPPALKPLRSKFFAAGKKEVESTGLKNAQARVTELEAELTAAREEAESARKAAPDLAERDAAWQRKVEKAEAKAAAAEAEAAKVREEADTNALSSALKGLVRPRYAELVAPSARARIRRKEDGTREVLDGDGVPVEIPKGRTPEQVLAKMIADEAEPVDRLAGGDSGAGVSNGAGVGAGTLTEAQLIERKRANPMYAGFR